MGCGDQGQRDLMNPFYEKFLPIARNIPIQHCCCCYGASLLYAVTVFTPWGCYIIIHDLVKTISRAGDIERKNQVDLVLRCLKMGNMKTHDLIKHRYECRADTGEISRSTIMESWE